MKIYTALALSLIIFSIGLFIFGFALFASVGTWEYATEIGRAYGNTRTLSQHPHSLLVLYAVLGGMLFASAVKLIKIFGKGKKEKVEE